MLETSAFHLKKTTLNLISVIGGEMLLRVANFAVAVVVGRLYGVATFATYATVLAFVTVAERLADNGLELAGIAESSEHPDRSSQILGTLYLVKTLLSTVALLVLAAIAAIIRLSPDNFILASILTLRIFLYSYCRLHSGIMKSLDRMLAIGTIQSAHFLFLLGGIAVVYRARLGINLLLSVLLTGQFLEFLVSLTFLHRIGVRPSLTGIQSCLKIARRATPIGFTYTMAAMILRGDVIILSLIAPAAVLGSFAAANTGLVTVYVVAWLFGGVILAPMSKIAGDRIRLRHYAQRWAIIVLSLAVPLSLLATLIAPWMLTFLFGSAFVGAASCASIMALSVPLILLNAVFLSFAIARRAVREYVGVFLLTGIVSVSLDFILGKGYGPNGIAWAIVLRELVSSLAFLLCASRSDREVILGTADMSRELPETGGV